MKKRFVSLLLAISMILSLMPVSAVTAFAESENGGEVTTVDSGYCGADDGGENLRWTLDNNGVLTITGSGAMKDYPRYENQRPDWYLNHKDSIRSVVLDNKITHIGDYAFDGCTSIKSVRYTGYTGNAGVALPESVTTIGVHAFSDTGVTGTLKLPEHLTEIDSLAFYHCRKLNGELKLPDTVKEIGGFAFNRCGFTGKLKLPASLENIGNDAFESCSGLTGKLTFPSKMNEIDFSIFHETGITEVVIPSSIKTVRDFAFDSCMNLKKVYLPTEIPKIYNRAFRGCDNVKFYYPAYKADWMTQTSKFLDSTLNADKDAVKPSEVNTWRPICYYVDVTFDAGSGKFQNGEQKHIVKGNENELYRTENLTEAMVTAIGTPKQSGYHFAGWSLKQNGSVTDVLPVDENGYMTIADNGKNDFGGVEDGMTLYAVYTSAASVKINGIDGEATAIKAGKEHEFTLTGKENTDTGATVTLELNDSTNAKLEYYNSTTEKWQEVTDAFKVRDVRNMKFRVAVPKNADDATVTLTAVVKDAKGHEIEDGGDSKTFKVNKYVNAKVTITDLDNTTVKAGEAQDFTVNVTLNDDANTGAKATITVSGANADAVEKIQYKDGETWKDVPGEGLSIDKINNTEFKLITKADANDGDVTITVTAKKANDTEIDKKVAAVTVKKHENAAVTIDGLDGTTVKAGEAKEFTVSVTPNDDANTGAKATITVSGANADAVEKIQYKDGETWKDVPGEGLSIDKINNTEFKLITKADANDGDITITVTANKANGTEIDKKVAAVTVTKKEEPVTPGGGSTGGGENPGENPGGGSTGGSENPGENPGGNPGSGSTKPEQETPKRKLEIADGTLTSVMVKDKNGNLKDITDTITKDLDGKYEIPVGAKVTITAKDAPEGMKFGEWSISDKTLLSDPDVPYTEKDLIFTMPDNPDGVKLSVVYLEESIGEEPNLVEKGALAGTVVVGSAALLYQGHMLGTELYLRYLLPHGAIIPQNRAELAVLLWQDAENPEPVSTTLYSDISDEDSAIQQAARWAVENDLMEQLDAEEHPDHFDPFVPVTFSDSIRAWKKAQELKKSVH
ncbi:MAG: leucine-rich repeat protein [Faecalibacterium sp.]